MKIVKLSMTVRRGAKPDMVIEVDGIKITIPRLDREQRYELSNLIHCGRTVLELPCEVTKNND